MGRRVKWVAPHQLFPTQLGLIEKDLYGQKSTPMTLLPLPASFFKLCLEWFFYGLISALYIHVTCT